MSLGWPILLVFFLFLFWKRTFGNNSGFCRPTNKTLKGMQSLASNRKYHPLALYRGRICQNYEKSCTSMWQVCEILHDDRYGHKVFKNIARKLRLPSKSLLARNSIWLPPIKLNSVLQLLCALESCVILLFQCCYFFLGGGWGFHFCHFFCFKVIFKVKGQNLRKIWTKIPIKCTCIDIDRWCWVLDPCVGVLAHFVVPVY